MKRYHWLQLKYTVKAWYTSVVLLLLASTLALGAALSAMVVFAPFYAGDPLFPLQHWLEQVHLSFIGDETGRAERLLDLVELRWMDFRARIGTDYDLLALSYLDEAIDEAVAAVQAAPPESALRLRARLAALAADLGSRLKGTGLFAKAHPDLYAQALAKVEALLTFATGQSPDESTASKLMAMRLTPTPASEPDADTVVAVVARSTLNAPHSIPIPPDATAGPHSFFPLTGRHAAIACGDCHLNGVYQGSPRDCESCHAAVKPVNHYPGACSNCHNTSAWQPAVFDHTGFTDCVTCHLKDKPANHFEGQCSTCHNTRAWQPAKTFVHPAHLTSCATCHLKDKPANHFEGECATCHKDTGNWQNAIFDHSRIGAADCATCHLEDQPANHFPGACSSCHKDTTNWKNAVFNHSTIGNTDCAACHASRKPTNHYPGACSSCHKDTANWKNATFSHSTIGNTDCASCHASRKPANHYPGACSSCHTDTANWKNAVFDHSIIGNTDCSTCHLSRKPANHYDGLCSACHKDTTNWKNALFDHSAIGNTDCSVCHVNRAPANHFPAPCSSCHMDTTDWKNYTFNHTFPLNHHGANSQCALCHVNNDTYATYTCSGCHEHNKTKMDGTHKDAPNYSYDTCAACHANGKAP